MSSAPRRTARSRDRASDIGAGEPGSPQRQRNGPVWEVFRQERHGQPFQHAGSLVAPDSAFADAYAREQYGRRGESEALWVVPREAVQEVRDFADELNRNYHRVDGYSLKAKLKEARERAGTVGAHES